MSYYAHGFSPFQGQASQSYPFQQAAQTPVQPDNMFPGLQTPFPHAGYEQAQNMIPGLVFGAPANNSSWQPEPQVAPEPKLVPAAQYYQSTAVPAQRAVQDAGQSLNGTAEEGEVSEGEYDDIYEPAEATVIHHADGADDYDPADPGWYDASVNRQSSTSRRISALGNIARERSGSYSPYLSPRELQHTTKAPESTRHLNQPISQHQSFEPAQRSNGQTTTTTTEQKQKAAAAVMELWRLDVRFRNFVEEGIDPSVISSLLNDLGLDVAALNSQVAGTAVTPANKASANGKAPGQQTVAPSPKNAEERKDRIARLLAEKGAKSDSSPAAVGAGASQPNNQAKEEKEAKLRQKMEALQKAREARALKAASKKDSTAVASKRIEPTAPVASDDSSKPHVANDSVGSGPAKTITSNRQTTTPGSQNGGIPGLSIPMPQQAPVAHTRKRPVASDFVEVSTGPMAKRPFGQERRDRLVIDVSDASDDEDVEMDMGSGDESLQGNASHFIQRTTSFRDIAPLRDGALQRQQSSPAINRVATPRNDGLAQKEQELEQMKRKIALAEARHRLKMNLNSNKKEGATPKSGGQTPDADAEGTGLKPSLRRVQSMETSMAMDSPSLTGRSSPVLQEAESSRLPKRSDFPQLHGAARQERFRTLSQTLPQLSGRLQTKSHKLRLLQSQISRLEKEIAQESAEKKQMEDELAALEEAPSSEEPEQSEVPTTEQSNPELPDTTPITEPQAPAAPPPIASTDAAIAPRTPSEPVDEFTPSEPPAAVTNDATSIAVSESSTKQPEASAAATEEIRAVAEQSSSSGSPSEDVSPELAQDAQSDTAQGVDVEMEMHDGSEGQDEGQESDTGNVLPVPDPNTDDSQRVTPESLTVPNQISQGVSDSVPDEGLSGAREVYPADASLKSPDLTTRQPQASATIPGEAPGDKDGFKPYQSPFEYFREFRYHPSFANQVSGGLRSLTYSNQIDPNLPLCPDQLDGRQCPKGTECEFQHFESMKLPDDQILLQLGATKLEGAERSRFNSGLRQLLQDMREQNVKDFPRIAQGIVDYHNRFAGDSSKILSLGDVVL